MHVGLDGARNKVSMNMLQNLPIASVFPATKCSEPGRVWDPSISRSPRKRERTRKHPVRHTPDDTIRILKCRHQHSTYQQIQEHGANNQAGNKKRSITYDER